MQKGKSCLLGSAYEHPEVHVVTQYLDTECAANHIAQYFLFRPVEIHTSSFEMIPKRNQPDKWCPIFDLSSLVGVSIEL